MASQRFTTTRLSGLSAAGRIVELQHSVVAPFLNRELGPRHGRLFADFEPEGSDVRAWYADAASPLRRVADLPPEQAAALRAFTAELVGDVQALAERLAAGSPQQACLSRVLSAATTFPEEDVWCDGDQPIIVNWGFHRQDVPPGTPQPILAAGRVRVSGSAAGTAAPAPALSIIGGASWTWLRGHRTPMIAGLALWLLFALLVATCYRLLLPACGLDGGWPALRFGACTSEARTDGAAEGARLQALVRQAELRVAEERRICVPVPASARDAGLDEQIERRLPATAPRGEVEISLLWEGHADLDLIVDCPDGQKLSQASPGLEGCGGRLLRDINKAGDSPIEDPIEHAAWHSPLPGPYKIEVQLYGYNDVAQGSDISFTVRVRRGADTQVFASHIRGVRATVTAADVTF